MSTASIAVQTSLFGAPVATYVNDLATVGDFPAAQNIERIVKIVVHSGEIIDGLEITYLKKNGQLETVSHGGKGGSATPVELQANELIVGVAGRYQNPASTFYGPQVVAQISFTIADTSSNVAVPSVRIAGPFGQPSNSNLHSYAVNGSIIAIGTYSGPQPYLHGITFFKAFAQDITGKALDL